MSIDPACKIFLDFSRNKLLNQYWPRLRTAVEPLSQEQIWWRPNEASNSIGNLVLHLNGNVWQWLVASFNRLSDERDRQPIFLPALGGRSMKQPRSWRVSLQKSCLRRGISRDIR